MAFSDHKIAAFTHKITDLPDQPNLPADELKARFDSSPEELRVAHNALCDDADRLDDRVSGIIAGTFSDTISRDMLANEVTAELDAKATKNELAGEVSTLESADNALDARVEAIEEILPEKVEIYIGSFTGNGKSQQNISLPVTPDAALIITDRSGYGAVLTTPGLDLYDTSGNRLPYISTSSMALRGQFNTDGREGCYLIFKRL